MKRVSEARSIESPTALLFDWDGVLIRSENAKTASWVLAALIAGGSVPADLIGLLTAGAEHHRREAVRATFAFLEEEHLEALETVRRFAGLPRETTRKAVCAALLPHHADENLEVQVERIREQIKNTLVLMDAEPIVGTIRLVRSVPRSCRLGLVTQSGLRDVRSVAKAKKLPIGAFRVCVSAAGRAPVPLADATDPKTAAYEVALQRLSVRAAQAIAFEDSDSGIAAAQAAGVSSIALREESNRQALKRAAVVVNDLGCLAGRRAIRFLGPEGPAPIVSACDYVWRAGVVVGVVLGGTTVTVAQVLHGGDLARTEEVCWGAVLGGRACAEELVKLVAEMINRVAAGRFVVAVFVSTKGPARYQDGFAWLGPCTTLPFTSSYEFEFEFEARLANTLHDLGVRFGQTWVILDNLAALLGEMHPKGTLPREPSFTILIWGTGIGMRWIEKGLIFRDVGKDEEGDDRFRLLSSVGRTVKRDSSGHYRFVACPAGSL